MKWMLAALFLLGAGLVVWGPAPGVQSAERDRRAGDAHLILPMSFAHGDHGPIPCTACHHNFVDKNRGRSCIDCHLTDARVAPLFEEQFHSLCRSCHVEEHAAGRTSGPTRRCISCHVADNRF
ncbi:MAG TPA: cytochrome c3 family protein [Paracoccus sp. (in: a-proteobacteria)]|nr:cytochrome c3 family protein [Paracoccus sp. (in: a-proteobacteria)]